MLAVAVGLPAAGASILSAGNIFPVYAAGVTVGLTVALALGTARMQLLRRRVQRSD
ncbi:MAG: hypothetical protein ACYDAC_11760 [Candidatus Dormibacteria bacterium]